MNKKRDILNAWITVESLSEGSIKTKGDRELRTLDNDITDWEGKLLQFLGSQKQKLKISDKKFENSGIVLFLGIFDFNEVVDILRKKYNISKEYSESSNSEKFTAAVFFDKALKLADKFFYTTSGYIRDNGDFPKNIGSEEAALAAQIASEFLDSDFNTAFRWLLDKFNADLSSCRYKFIKDLEYDDINLHSFFIKDLERAKEIETDNLERYLKGHWGERINLDSKADSPNFDPETFKRILQPSFYPNGRFPSDPDYGLTLMQQVATNISIDDSEKIRSVNGPPGTGKTTLLKDIFSHMIVQQAAKICELPVKHIRETLSYWDRSKIGEIPESIADKNIIVASSNNGAVQNIVKELPKKESIAKGFVGDIIKADYFKELSDCEIELRKTETGTKLYLKKGEDRNWGAFSMEGGASINVKKILRIIEEIENDLNENYLPDENIYDEFRESYSELIKEKAFYQCCCNQLKELQRSKRLYAYHKDSFEKDSHKKQLELNTFQKKLSEKAEKLTSESNGFESAIDEIESALEITIEKQKEADRNYDLLYMKKPAFLWFKKLLNTKDAAAYFSALNDANNSLSDLSAAKTALLKDKERLKKSLSDNNKKIEKISKDKEKNIKEFNNWKADKNNLLKSLDDRIKELERSETLKEARDIDFSLSYNELQKSNPWFDKKYRIMQTELFISALKVKKQFLYENVKNLKKARQIWSHQLSYVGKENGAQIISTAWQWLNFAIPVISTTFASFGNMFGNMPKNSIRNLFIDEAGQALPQAAVGAIFRSEKILALGDPSQIKPVLTLDANVLSLIGRNYSVTEKFVSADASVQTIIDAAGKYGYQKNDDEWIGIPLWVHRRSKEPMFEISNRISYNNMMVQGKPADKSYGKAYWYNVRGHADDKFVKSQFDFLIEAIEKKLKESSGLKDEIFVISPFKNVAYRVSHELQKIGFTKWDNGKPVNVGTVHTFQGKEAKIVYLILGADSASKNAAFWAVSEPNIMNVSATRAKEEFYIVGDKKLYLSLGSKVIETVAKIIDEYNESTE